MNRRDFIKKAALLGGVLLGGLATTRALAKGGRTYENALSPEDPTLGLYRGEIGTLYDTRIMHSGLPNDLKLLPRRPLLADAWVSRSTKSYPAHKPYPGLHFRQLGKSRISKGYDGTIKIPRWKKPLLSKDIAKMARELREYKGMHHEDYVAPLNPQVMGEQWLFAPGAFYGNAPLKVLAKDVAANIDKLRG